MTGTESNTTAPVIPRFIREPECRKLTGLSRGQRWKLERARRFPLRVPLGDKARGWLESEVLAWMADRVKERDRSQRTSPDKLAA